jgi:hypothetical protein
MTKVLCVDSAWDEATKLTRAFRDQHVYPMAGANELVLRQGTQAKRVGVSASAVDVGVGFITGASHGTPDCFTGDQMEILWQVDQYGASEVTGKIVHLLACYAARRLGPNLVQKGAIAFLGYDTEFVFTKELADSFLACDAEIDLVLLAGGSVEEAHCAAIEAFEDALAQAETPQIAALFESNRDHLKSPVIDARFGDSNARLA